MLYVSHDRYFINRTATRILDLTGRSFVNYIGNYDYYLEKKEDVEAAHFQRLASVLPGSVPSSVLIPGGKAAAAIFAPEAGPVLSEKESSAAPAGKLEWKAQKEEQARIRKLQNDLKKTEDEIHRLETRDAEIDGLLALEEVYTDVARLMELNKEKEEGASRLEELYARWEELAEEI